MVKHPYFTGSIFQAFQAQIIGVVQILLERYNSRVEYYWDPWGTESQVGIISRDQKRTIRRKGGAWGLGGNEGALGGYIHLCHLEWMSIKECVKFTLACFFFFFFHLICNRYWIDFPPIENFFFFVLWNLIKLS